MKETGLKAVGPPKISKFKAWRQNKVAKTAESTDMYKQHPTLFDFSVIVSKNVSSSGNLLCVFKLSKSDGCPFLLKSFMKLKIIQKMGHTIMYNECRAVYSRCQLTIV